MKDILKRVISTVISLIGLSTLGIYYYQGVPLVKEYVLQYNTYVLGLVGGVLVVFFLQFGLIVLSGKWLKVRAIVMGLLLVLGGFYFVNNDAAIGMYAGDIISLLGVLIIYLTLAGLIVTKKAEKKLAKKKQVIIEV